MGRSPSTPGVATSLFSKEEGLRPTLYRKRTLQDDNNHQFAESSKSRTPPPPAGRVKLIQPQSRAQFLYPVKVVEEKIEKDLGMAQLKIRLSTNLTQLSPNWSLTALSQLRPGTTNPYLSPNVSLQSGFFTLDNGLGVSIANSDGEVDDESDARMAPYGGFLDAQGVDNVLNHVFDTAPWQFEFTSKGNVSLTKAVQCAKEEKVVKNIRWVGVMAMPSDEVLQKVLDEITIKLDAKNCDAVWPLDLTFSGAYLQFCKQILWPTLHYQIPDDPKSKAFEDHLWKYYRDFNQMVADKAVELFLKTNGDNFDSPDSIIWVHDYHLLLVPQMVREKLPNVKIGLFLHVSFPLSEVFRCFAYRNEILEGMLGANVITFQSQEYVRHFLQTCNRLLLADVTANGLTFGGKFITTNTIPVGIDEKPLVDLVRLEDIHEWRTLIREKYGDKKIILSRDKVDKLRGIKQKFLAYEKFLKSNPEMLESTVFIQILMGTVADSAYELEIMKIALRINLMSENISNITPLVLLKTDLEFEQYVALQCEADLFIVLSMREGLNLTCHEFICATHDKKSPLMLSEFTGSAQLLYCSNKGALLINPWDIGGFANTIQRCLQMSPKEKIERWQNQYNVVKTRDSSDWVRRCLTSINQSWSNDQSRKAINSTRFTHEVLTEHLDQAGAGTKLFVLNFELPNTVMELDTSNNTISDKTFGTNPSRFMLYVLPLLEDKLVRFFIVLYQEREVLNLLYARYPQVGIVAENGGFIKFPELNKWISLVDEHDRIWITQCVQLMDSKVERLPGLSVKAGECTVTFHPGTALVDDRDRALDAMGDCIQHINEVFSEVEGLHASLLRNVVVVQNDQLTLRAALFLLDYYAQVYSIDELVDIYHIKGEHPECILEQQLTDKLSFASFTGGVSQIDEPIYEYMNEWDGIETKCTVSVINTRRDERTLAHYVVNGRSEFLSTLLG